MRDNGYYWVLIQYSPERDKIQGHEPEWIIAEWFYDIWFLMGVETTASDSDFIEIGKRIRFRQS